MRLYTNANAHFIFALKVLSSHTDAIKGSVWDVLYTWLYHGHKKTENIFLSLPGAADKSSV